MKYSINKKSILWSWSKSRYVGVAKDAKPTQAKGINGVLIVKLKVKYKKNMEVSQKKNKILNLYDSNLFYYKFSSIIKIDLFKDYTDTTHVDKVTWITLEVKEREIIC